MVEIDYGNYPKSTVESTVELLINRGHFGDLSLNNSTLVLRSQNLDLYL